MIRLSNIHADLPEDAEVPFIALVWRRNSGALEAGLLPHDGTKNATWLTQAALTYEAAHALISEGERILKLAPREP